MVLVALGTLGYRKHSWTVCAPFAFLWLKISSSLWKMFHILSFLNAGSTAFWTSLVEPHSCHQILYCGIHLTQRFCGTSSAEYSFWNEVERVAASAFETDKLLFFGVHELLYEHTHNWSWMQLGSTLTVCCSMKKGLWLQWLPNCHSNYLTCVYWIATSHLGCHNCYAALEVATGLNCTSNAQWPKIQVKCDLFHHYSTTFLHRIDCELWMHD